MSDEENLSTFNPNVPAGYEDLAVAEANHAAKSIAAGGHIVKFLIMARGLEVLCERAVMMSNSQGRKGKRYNDALGRQMAAHPALAQKALGKNLSAAVWLLHNWELAKPYINRLTPAQLADFNAQSLRVQICRHQKAEAGGETKPKKPGLKESVAILQERNDTLIKQLRDYEREISKGQPLPFDIEKDGGVDIARELVNMTAKMPAAERIKHLREIAAEINREIKNLARGKLAKPAKGASATQPN